MSSLPLLIYWREPAFPGMSLESIWGGNVAVYSHLWPWTYYQVHWDFCCFLYEVTLRGKYRTIISFIEKHHITTVSRWKSFFHLMAHSLWTTFSNRTSLKSQNVIARREIMNEKKNFSTLKVHSNTKVLTNAYVRERNIQIPMLHLESVFCLFCSQ